MPPKPLATSCYLPFVQLCLNIWAPLELFPLNSVVNKLCNIECCGNKKHQIIQNMILSSTFGPISNIKDAALMW